MTTISDFIEKMLEIIGYGGNRADYAKSFIEACIKKAHVISPNDYSKGLHQATQEMVTDLLTIASRHLTPEQKEELKKHLETFPR